jgi:Flp pilus assembly pilin Flp
MKNVNNAALFNPMLTSNAARLARRRGQTLVEYALILAIISVVAIGLLINLGQQVKGIYSSIDSAVASAAASH